MRARSEADAALLAGLAEILQVAPAEVELEMRLDDSNWDSVAIISAIALIDEHQGVTVPGKDLRACRTVGDILDLAHTGGQSRTT